MTIKQVIVMRKKFTKPNGETFVLGRGKEIAQACHASMSFMTKRLYSTTGGRSPDTYCIDLTMNELSWIEGSFAKVTLQVDTEEELRALHERAKAEGLESHLITDSGKTYFDGKPTVTCLAIGPDDSAFIDPITGPLKLY